MGIFVGGKGMPSISPDHVALQPARNTQFIEHPLRTVCWGKAQTWTLLLESLQSNTAEVGQIHVLNIQLQWLLESQRDSNLNPTYCLSSGELYVIFLSLFPHLKNRHGTAHLVGLWELTLQVVNSLQMFILSISVSSSLIYNWQRRFHHRSSQQSCETRSLRIGSILICGRGKLRLRGLSVEFTRIRLIEWYT